MALAKGTNLAPARAQMARDAYALARTVFAQWATIDAPNVPPDTVDATQVRLCRWQEEQFGNVPRTDAIMALGIVEELAETFEADDEPEEAIDGLGDICVYAAQICTLNRMAFRPVLELATLYCVSAQDRKGMTPIEAAGQLTHVVGKHEQRTRGLGSMDAYGPALADAIALVIAKALEYCAIMHSLRIRAEGVFTAIAAEVMQRKAGDVMIPTVTITHLEIRDPDAFVAEMSKSARKAEAVVKLAQGMELLERVNVEGDFDISDVVAEAGICPQCAAPMSHHPSKPMFRCNNGHEFTEQQMLELITRNPRTVPA